MLPASPIIVVLMILLVLQYIVILNKGVGFLARTALELPGRPLSWEAVIVWTVGVLVAGLALGILISEQYALIDRWYASLLLAVMAGHCTCVWKTEDPSWRKAYLKEISEAKKPREPEPQA
jgi:hypothetical protein